MKDHCEILKRSKGRYYFIKAWTTPKDVLSFIKSFFKGKVLNLCCGSALIGDVNVDLYHKAIDINGISVICEDVLDPNFDLKEQFDTIVADPPYNWPYQERAMFNRNVGKHLKKGGIFLLNAPWLPRCFMFDIKETWVIYQKGGLPANVTLLTVAIKK